MTHPISTYRLQFHKEFTFAHFRDIIPYLHQLGIKTIYASPIFEATPGSVHGYDGMNPHKINPEIGSEEELLDISRQLKELDMQWVQDIVPNHMAFDPKNPWLKDVLEKGQRSVYAPFFDVPWTGKLFSGKIMLPFLASSLNEIIDNGELSIAYEAPRFVLKYYDNSWPIRLRTYINVLEAAPQLPNQAVKQLLEQVSVLRREDEPAAYHELLHEFQLQLGALMKNEATNAYIEQCITTVNEDKVLLGKIASDQVYQLTHWQKTDQRITFRRFFTVNGLICLNMQNDEVFNHYHLYIKELVDKEVFQGLRIDHIDGLFDPEDYLQKLRRLVGNEVYIVVEKILEPGEQLPNPWPIQGTTGYDFLATVNNVFTNSEAADSFTKYYRQLTNDDRSLQQQITDSKRLILDEYMGGELNNLHHLFTSLNLVPADTMNELPEGLLKEAIARFLIQCPVYRFYGNKLPLNDDEATSVQAVLTGIINDEPLLAPAVALLQKAILQPEDDSLYLSNALRFYQRCMQFTGPLMAKGVEDTLMYTYNRFIAHNDVGDAPADFGADTRVFHSQMQQRQQYWPLTMNTTSTHDTKRGEDVRARLNVLTDLNEAWLALAAEWHTLNAALRKDGIPDDNDEYLVYQSLIGAAPMPGTQDDLESRMQQYLQKALREAKRYSNWTLPNEAYETGVNNFTTSLLTEQGTYRQSFQTLLHTVVDFGIVNSLVQVLLKFTCPGVPDTYQGTELWDLSLVDPDNRRLVDYTIRRKILAELKDVQASKALQDKLWEQRYNGSIKLWLIRLLLQLRQEASLIFAQGEYIPLEATGIYSKHIIAFARCTNDACLIIAAGLHLPGMCNNDASQILHLDWKDTALLIPERLIGIRTNIFTNERVDIHEHLAVQDIFSPLPLAILK